MLAVIDVFQGTLSQKCYCEVRTHLTVPLTFQKTNTFSLTLRILIK